MTTEIVFPIDSERIRVMVVDDTDDNVGAYVDYLEHKCPRWEIVGHTDSESASQDFLESLRDGRPFDVVVADLIMEEADSGYLLVERMLLVSQAVVAIVISATAEDFNRSRALKAGIFDVISKNRYGETFAEHLLYRVRTGAHLRRTVQQAERVRRFVDPLLSDRVQLDPSILEQREQRLAIAFWDLAGFSALAESLRGYPSVVGSFLDDFFSSASEIVNDHGGAVDKFLGDGIMALFGLFGSTEAESCQAAIGAARSVRTVFEDTLGHHRSTIERHTANPVAVSLRCGIHIDEVLVGMFAAGQRDHFTAIGSAVNLASRLESYAKDGQILISQPIAVNCPEDVNGIEPDVISGLKNISGDFVVYRL